MKPSVFPLISEMVRVNAEYAQELNNEILPRPYSNKAQREAELDNMGIERMKLSKCYCDIMIEEYKLRVQGRYGRIAEARMIKDFEESVTSKVLTCSVCVDRLLAEKSQHIDLAEYDAVQARKDREAQLENDAKWFEEILARGHKEDPR